MYSEHVSIPSLPRIMSAGCLTAASSSSSSVSSPSPADPVSHTKHPRLYIMHHNACSVIVVVAVRCLFLLWLSGSDHDSAGGVLHPVLQTGGLHSGLQHQLGGPLRGGDALPSPRGRSRSATMPEHSHAGFRTVWK